MITKEQVLEFLKNDENKSFLTDNGFQTEVEKKVEVPAQLSDDVVKSYIEGNQGLKDKMYNSNVTEFLKKRTGKEEIKPEDLGAKLLFENDVNASNDNYKKALIEANMHGVKNPELLVGLIDGAKVEFKDGKLEGFDNQLAELKTKYPDQFGEPTPPNTPPAPQTPPPASLTYEQFASMSPEEQANVPTAELDRMMTEA